MRTFLTSLAAALLPASVALAADDVTLQLKWVTQSQFAGYYVALDKGFYEAEGLNVSESQIMALARFYTAALAGLTLEWIGSGMKGEPDSFIDDLGGMLDGNIRCSLERGCAHAAQ